MSDIERHAIPDELNRARKALGRAMVGSLVVMVLLPPFLGFEVDFLSFWGVATLAGVPAVFIPYVTWRKMWAFRSILELSSVSILLLIPTIVFTYSTMRLNMPIADAMLIKMDEAIGFDWPAFVRLVDQSPLAAQLLQFGYESFVMQLLILPILLCILQYQTRAFQFVLSFLFLCGSAAVISVPFPSLGAYVGHGFDGATLHNVNARFGYYFLESFHAVREQERFVLTVNNLAGIITFPSIHAGVAVLCAWAAWPSRWLRFPILALNILMFVSAITHGAHYLVDVIAGGAVAALAIRMAAGPHHSRTALHQFLQTTLAPWRGPKVRSPSI